MAENISSLPIKIMPANGFSNHNCEHNPMNHTQKDYSNGFVFDPPGHAKFKFC